MHCGFVSTILLVLKCVCIQSANVDMEIRLAVYERRLTEQDNIIEEQREIIRNLQNIVNNLSDSVDGLQDNMKLALRTDPETKYQFSEIGCYSDLLTLSCPSGRIIDLTSANYGKYYYSCSTCCAPSPLNDCTELVSENRPADWAAVIYSCQNQTSCSYEYRGSPIDQCQNGYQADYMQIFYNCVPGDVDEPVGFSAYATVSVNYGAGNVILFPGVISNIGGYYNSTTSTFICPYNGVYVFNINIVQYSNAYATAELWIENSFIIEAWVQNTNAYASAGVSAVTTCTAGQRVWVRAEAASYIFGHSDGNSQFTGFLLKRT